MYCLYIIHYYNNLSLYFVGMSYSYLRLFICAYYSNRGYLYQDPQKVPFVFQVLCPCHIRYIPAVSVMSAVYILGEWKYSIPTYTHCQITCQ